jgi:transcription initiation factor TFIIIB Brf1 subunit/transcription initiation factor TFIIB
MAGRQEGMEMRFCPYCFMQQFEVSEDATEGSVYCEVCGIDVPVKELEKL